MNYFVTVVTCAIFRVEAASCSGLILLTTSFCHSVTVGLVGPEAYYWEDWPDPYDSALSTTVSSLSIKFFSFSSILTRY